jgi:hypothetical protein
VVRFDEYDRKARLTPGLLAIAPVSFLVAALGWKSYPVVAVAGGILVAAGASYVLAVLVRHLGRRVESRLWTAWGGPPTSSLLRTRVEAGNATLRDSWRRAIEAASGIQLLTADEEAAEPEKADEVIEAAVRHVLYLGYDDSYPLVKKENIQYGFERNFYGSRWVGRAISASCVLALAVSLGVGGLQAGGSNTSPGAMAAAIAIDAAFLLGWCLLPSAHRAQLAAARYANQLLQAAILESRRSGHPT